MASRVTHGHFERFAQHRLDFVRNIAALAEREDYLEVRDGGEHLGEGGGGCLTGGEGTDAHARAPPGALTQPKRAH